MAIFLSWNLYAHPQALDAAAQRKAWIWSTVGATCGLAFSLFHLGHPFTAYKALYNLGASWLSWEGLGFACFCGLAFVNIFCHSRALALLAAFAGAFGLYAQGMTYAAPSIPALNNILPMAFFWLSALAMGACALAIVLQGKDEHAERYALIALITLLIAGPTIWISGTTTMRESSLLWLTSFWFWAGIILGALALAATWCPAQKRMKWRLLTLAVIRTRRAFFADSAHTAGNLGLPFN